MTTDAGRPWPHPDVAQAYTREGEFELVLTTTWAGRFRVVGAAEWLTVAGTATTTSDPVLITAVEAHSHLVAGSGP